MSRRAAGLLAAFLAAAAGARAEPSRLWGRAGERWSPESRLPDFSWAGYRAGETPIPDAPTRGSVKDFGAIGDGLADDTTAFLKAIAATWNGALLIPAGRYKITGVLRIRKSGLVLRGEGEGRTVLFFPKPLAETVGPGPRRAPGGSWSWSGAYLSLEGRDNGETLAEVTAPAKRGGRRLAVSSAASLAPGQWVRLVMTDPDGSLARHLQADQEEGSANYRGRALVDFASPIESIAGAAVVLKRPLRTDVRNEWKPVLKAFLPSVQDVGLENLALEFPETPYAGHHDEPGYNAVSFDGVANGWIRRVLFVNADSGVYFRERARFCTAESLRFAAGPRRLRIGYGRDKGEPTAMAVGGHHGLLIESFSQDNLATDFVFEFRFIHDVSVASWAAGNVFARGRGIDMDFDHHRRAPYENLFTDIQAGEGSRLWQSGGDESDGPPSGARETFWNIRTDRPQSIPPWSVQGNFIGVTTLDPSESSRDRDWWESVAPASLFPADLHSAQLARRLSSK